MTIPRDTIVGVCLLALAVAYWLGADAIPTSRLAGGVGADGLPKALAYALGFLSLMLIGRSLAMWQAAQAERLSPEEAAEDRRRHLRAIGMFGFGTLYVLLLPWLGYLLSVILLVGGVAWYNGKAPSPMLVAVAVGTGVLFYFLFVRFLDIAQPPGLWPDLLRGWAA
ncbi:MAG TPA: tripartite tricarboxylate transporter TctB family protein [Afifellaceae bacterium]|nr:tripartite tricarboxylate transporter TctB family protein [Afifellaceae bacterium]